MPSTPARFLTRNEYRILGLMLFSLLFAILPGQGRFLAQSALIIHFGFFLLWQPLLKQQQTFSPIQTVVLTLTIFTYVWWFNPWFSAFWVLVLLTLLTGRIFTRGSERLIYTFAVMILLLQLILIITPQLFHLTGLNPAFQDGMNLLIMFSPLLMLLFRAGEAERPHVDFMRGFVIVILIVFLCMGSVLFSFTSGMPYIPSLIYSLLVLGLFLIVSSIMWAPPGGITGLARLWEKYLLNIGGPFEEWLSHINREENRQNIRPDEFLSASAHYLMSQSWVAGVAWRTSTDENTEGECSRHALTHHDDKMRLTIYTAFSIGPALSLHAKLILHVLAFYYRAKCQEQAIIRQAHLQAIYETGSKLTHDVKNILQATQTMTQIVQAESADRDAGFAILRKQLPLLSTRLQATLKKLQAPDTARQTEPARQPVVDWWQALQQRYPAARGAALQFVSGQTLATCAHLTLPPDLFDTVAENLIENARNKQQRETGIDISVTLEIENDQPVLTVCDSGSALPEDKRARLFTEPLPSDDGYGIALYQCRQLARRHRFDLSLRHNETGRVCFQLAARSPSQGN